MKFSLAVMVKFTSVIFRISHLSILLFFIAISHSTAVSYPVDPTERDITGSSIMERRQDNKTYLPRFTYEVPPNKFFCEVRPAPPLTSDALYAIKLLRDNAQQLPVCHHPHGGSGANFCTTLSRYKSAGIAICTASRGLVNCPEIAWVAMALLRKCEAIDRDHRVRTGGLVRMKWGYIIVFNNDYDPHALGRVWGFNYATPYPRITGAKLSR